VLSPREGRVINSLKERWAVPRNEQKMIFLLKDTHTKTQKIHGGGEPWPAWAYYEGMKKGEVRVVNDAERIVLRDFFGRLRVVGVCGGAGGTIR